MKKNILLISLILASLMLCLPNNYALDKAPDETLPAEDILLYMGEVKITPLHNPTRIIIGNPSVVDVSNITTSEMTLTPKAVGTTRLVYWDSYGEHAFQAHIYPENMTILKQRVDAILKNLNMPTVYTQAAEEESKVLLLGKVKTPQEKERINTALEPLKAKIVDLILVREEESSIEIDVQVLELDRDATSKIGFNWPAGVNITEIGSPALMSQGAMTVVTGATPSTTQTLTPGGSAWGNLFRVINVTRDAFTLTVDALAQEGKARILSRPRLTCQSGKEAVLLVGGEKPILTTSVAATTGATGTNIEYKEFGIKLKIKPTTTENKQIKLALGVEISEVGEADTIGTTTSVTAKAYPLSKRNVSTELFLNDGQTLAIGGLIKQKEEELVRKTPFLGDLPLIGALFRSKTTKSGSGIGEKGNTELFITMTPKIIGYKPVAGVVPEKTEPLPEPLPTPPAPTPQISQPQIPQQINTPLDYSLIVQRRILENISYPAKAKEAGFQGAVKLKLLISDLGRMMEARVSSSSGYKILDDTALNTAQEIAEYPPFPPSIQEKELWVEIPVVYRLD